MGAKPLFGPPNNQMRFFLKHEKTRNRDKERTKKREYILNGVNFRKKLSMTRKKVIRIY